MNGVHVVPVGLAGVDVPDVDPLSRRQGISGAIFEVAVEGVLLTGCRVVGRGEESELRWTRLHGDDHFIAFRSYGISIIVRSEDKGVLSGGERGRTDRKGDAYSPYVSVCPT
jgi:hypothetical protein